MPHVELPNISFAREALLKKLDAARKGIERSHFHHNVAPRIAEIHEVDYLNLGSHKIVFVHPADTGKVVTAEHWNESSSVHKQTYYLHNIYNALWPHNIPRIFASGKTADERPIAWSIRQRIIDQSIESAPVVRYPFKLMRSESADHDIDMSVHFDPHPANFIVGTDLGEYYVDNIDQFGQLPLDRVLNLASVKKLSLSEIERLTTYVIRFNALANDTWDQGCRVK